MKQFGGRHGDHHRPTLSVERVAGNAADALDLTRETAVSVEEG